MDGYIECLFEIQLRQTHMHIAYWMETHHHHHHLVSLGASHLGWEWKRMKDSNEQQDSILENHNDLVRLIRLTPSVPKCMVVVVVAIVTLCIWDKHLTHAYVYWSIMIGFDPRWTTQDVCNLFDFESREKDHLIGCCYICYNLLHILPTNGHKCMEPGSCHSCAT